MTFSDDLGERTYVSQYSNPEIGLLIYKAGALADGDSNLVTARMESLDGLSVIFDRSALHTSTGTYEVVLASGETEQPGLYKVTWAYSLDLLPQVFVSIIEVGQSAPAYDRLSDGMKSVVESAWMRFADLFDSPLGGPHLQVYFQSRFTRGRMAQLLQVALGRLNTVAQPHMTYTLMGPPDGNEFPLGQWGGLLDQACVAPETLILKSDLTWAPAESLRVGDKIVAFDEDIRQAKFRTAEVEFNQVQIKPRVRVETPKRTLSVTPDHKFVVRRKSSEKNGKIWYRRYWVEAQDLKPGRDEILSIGEPWAQANDFRHGYLAGMLDGEGCLSLISQSRTTTSAQARLSIAQRPGAVLDQTSEYLTALGFDHSIGANGAESSGVLNLHIRGGVGAVMRALGTLRPARMIGRPDLSRIWEGVSLRNQSLESVPVLSVEGSLDGPVSVMQTSTGTFIADGLLSHNCYIEALKHLIRSYVEQPEAVGVNVARMDRRDYMSRWQQVLEMEIEDFKGQMDVFKMAHMGLGRPRVLVSGGVYGNFGPTRLPGSAAARPRYYQSFHV